MSVSGPFVKTETSTQPPAWTGYRAPGFEMRRSWYTQSKPYRKPLPFSYESAEVTVRVYSGIGAGYVNLGHVNRLDDMSVIYAVNKAYGKFIDKMSDRASIGVNLVERRQALDMMSKRVLQLTRFTRAVRRLDFVSASRALDVRFRPSRATKKRLADSWLEYHFGWEPLVKDIGSAMKTLTRDFSEMRVSARGSDVSRIDEAYHRHPQHDVTVRSVKTDVTMRARVRTTNPNATLLVDMGFINPVAVAWETVPFSFVVDWFTNVGQVLNSYSDFAGRVLIDPSTTVFQTRDYLNTSSGYDYGGNLPYWPGDTWWSSIQGCRGISCRRSSGITGPTLTVRPFVGFSVSRGATAVALLLQQLARVR